LLELDVSLRVDVITVAVMVARPIGIERSVSLEPHVENAARRNVAAILCCEEQLAVACIALRQDPRHRYVPFANGFAI